MGTLLLTFILISPAYAEVSCTQGWYTGYRYRFRDDPIVTNHPLTRGTHFYIITSWNGRCLFANTINRYNNINNSLQVGINV